MCKFSKLFNKIKKRPGMYFPNDLLIEATNYIAGMDSMQDKPLREEFRQWMLKYKLKENHSVYWPQLVTLYMQEEGIKESDHVVEFLNLFADFLDQRK